MKKALLKKYAKEKGYKHLEFDEYKELLEYTEWLEQKALSLSDVGQSLALVEIDKDILKICVDAYKDGEKIEAIKTLIEEAKRVYSFGIKEAKEYLESQC